MKKSIATGMLGGLILVSPQYVFGYSSFFYINNLSTIESVVLYHNPSAGSGWYHCPYGTGDGTGPNKYAIPPMNTVEIQFNSNDNYLAQNVQMWAQLPDALLPIASIYQWQSETMLYSYCIASGGYCLYTPTDPKVMDYNLQRHNIFANSGFYDAMYLTNGVENINYISSFCPTIQDANNMLQNYATGTCPSGSTPYSQTFVDPQWRLWSISCSNRHIDSVTKFTSAQIEVNPQDGAHTETIYCKYTNDSESFSTTFTNLDSHVLLPVNGQGDWSTSPGIDYLSGSALCGGSNNDPQQCQWAYASKLY